MNDAASAVHYDAADTLRPPPPEMPRSKRGKGGKGAQPPERKLAVVVPCEDEQQQTMLLEWLVGNGFEAQAVEGVAVLPEPFRPMSIGYSHTEKRKL